MYPLSFRKNVKVLPATLASWRRTPTTAVCEHADLWGRFQYEQQRKRLDLRSQNPQKRRSRSSRSFPYSASGSNLPRRPVLNCPISIGKWQREIGPRSCENLRPRSGFGSTAPGGQGREKFSFLVLTKASRCVLEKLQRQPSPQAFY